jgi:hypothetical protein
MKKFVIALVVASLGMTAAGCGRSQPYPTDYDQQQQVSQVQPQGSFLDRHGDAILAGGAGLVAGKMWGNHQNRQHVYVTRPYSYYPRTGYHYVAPPRVVYHSAPVYRSTYRSSGYGSYRSRR